MECANDRLSHGRDVHSGKEGDTRDDDHDEGEPEIFAIWTSNEASTAAKTVLIHRFLVYSTRLAVFGEWYRRAIGGSGLRRSACVVSAGFRHGTLRAAKKCWNTMPKMIEMGKRAMSGG